MVKKEIYFKANDRQLTLNGGVFQYVPHEVNFIEAHFELGQNWDEFAAVRAVWWTDFVKGVSTVLDADGVCYVPQEVLVRKAKVHVNLVGSDVVDDTLVDRLLTNSVVGVCSCVDSRVEGTETAPITPSQFEQFVEIVHEEVSEITGMSATAETLPAGSDATASYSDGVLSFGIPRGERGESGQDGRDGEDGNGIESAVLNSDYTLTLNFTDGTSYTTTSIRGAEGNGIRSITKTSTSGLVDTYTITFTDGTTTTFTVTNGERGETGLTPSFSIGTVETLEPGESATATITGTDEDPVLNLGIPRGEDGETPVIPWDDILPTDTASGQIASFPDGTDLLSAKSVSVELEPIQDLHGYDKPWSAGAGKNKLIQGETQTYTSNGVTWTANADGSVTARGTAVGDSTFTYIGSEVGYNFNGNYKFVFFPSISATVMQAGIYIGKWISVYSNTTTSLNDLNAQIGQLWFQIKDGQTADVTFYPMIYSASETAPTAWSPYENLCPISGRTECVTEVCGKNLWDDEQTSFSSTYWSRSGNTYTSVITTSSTYVWQDLYLFAGKTYTLSGNLDAVSNDQLKAQFRKNNSVVATVYKNSLGAFSVSYTPTESGIYRVLVGGTDNGTITFSKIQLELGSTATSYEPYDSTTYTTTLGRTVYGGSLDVVSGELVVDRAMVDLGSLNWAINGRRFLVQLMGAKGSATDSTVANIVCSCYEAVTNNQTYGGTAVGISLNKDENAYCGVYDPTYTDVATFKSAVSGQTLCYELATPQTYQLTAQDIALLHGNNNVWSDGEVEVEYYADIQLYIEKKLG